MTSHMHFSRNFMNEWTKSRFKVVVTPYGRNKNRDDEIKKNIAGRTTQRIFIDSTKNDLEWTRNGLEKTYRKKSDSKNRRKVKTKVKLPHLNKKTTSEKANFCSNAVFSLYFKIRAKNIHAAKPLAFLLQFLFRRDQNHHSNLTSTIMRMCEQILKKRQRPNTIQILWIVKNQEKRNNSPSYRCAAINIIVNFQQFSLVLFHSYAYIFLKVTHAKKLLTIRNKAFFFKKKLNFSRTLKKSFSRILPRCAKNDLKCISLTHYHIKTIVRDTWVLYNVMQILKSLRALIGFRRIPQKSWLKKVAKKFYLIGTNN